MAKLYWMPKRRTIQSDIEAELARIETLKEEQFKTEDVSAPEIELPIWRTRAEIAPEVRAEIPSMETWQPRTPRIPFVPEAPTPVITPPIPEAPLKWFEKPKAFGEAIQTKLGAGLATIPGVKPVIEKLAPGFEWIHEKVEKPWSAMITAPWSPELPWKPGESWIEHEKREYEKWQAPIYIKGLAEFSMPLWWMPWLGWAGKGMKAMIGAGKAAKLAASLPKLPHQALLPTYTQFEKFIPNNILKRAVLRFEHTPVIGRMIKAVGGEAAFTRRNPITLADKARNYAVFYGIHRDMGENIVRIMMNDLPMKRILMRGGKQQFIPEEKLLKLYEIEVVAGRRLNAKVGMVTVDATHPGVLDKAGKVSYYMDDVWQNPNLYKWTDKAAFEYVKQGHETIQWFMNWAKSNGVPITGAKRGIKVVGEMIQEHIPRIAKGATTPEGLFAPFKRTNPFAEMVHDLMVEGVEAGVKYGGSFAERIELMCGAITRRVAQRKFTDAIKPMGKTVLERFEPVLAERLAGQANRVDMLSKALVALQKGSPVHSITIQKIKTEFPELAKMITLQTEMNRNSAIRFIQKMSKSSQLVVEKNRKPLIEALLAQPKRSTYYDVIDTVTRFAKDETKVIRALERIYSKELKAGASNYRKLLSHLKNDVLKAEKGKLAPITAEAAKLKRRLRIPYVEKLEAKFYSQPAFNKRIFPAEVVRTLTPILGDRGHQWVRNMAQVSGMSRMMVAALDLSAPFIQGLMVFGRNPVVWGKSVAKMMKIAKTPWKLHLELAARKASRLERVLYGGSTSSIDYFEAMPAMRRVAGKIRAERAVVETYGRAEAAFLGFGEIARDEMWKVGKFMLAKKGLSDVVMKERMRDLAASLDRMTGVMSPQALGIGVSQQQVESAWIFFAPRYTRAGLSYMGMMVRGGFTGAEARKAMAGLALGGVTMYTGICSALGQEPNFDPRSARFMTVKVGETHVGVGGIYYALLRFAANATATAVEEPGALSPLHLSRTDNPFYKFLYARTAPLTGLVTGLAIEQKNYFGEPFETPTDYAAFMADKVLPIAVQSVMPWERKPWQDTAFQPQRFGAEFMGMRAFPESAWEARDNYRENLAQNIYGKPWKELTRAEQRDIENDNLVLKKFDDEIVKWRIQRGKPDDILFNRWRDEIDEMKSTRDERIQFAASAANQDKDYSLFRQRIEDIENDYAATIAHINQSKQYASVREILEEGKTPEELSEMQYLDAAYTVWTQYRYSQVETPWGRLVNELGEPQWENVEKFRQWFRNTFGEQALQYSEQELPLAGRDLPELYLELRKARLALKPYWQVRSEAIKVFGEPKTEWQEKRIGRFVAKIRKRLRQTDPEIEKYYQMFYARS